jgi:putative ABC transport system permease protein
MRWLARWRPALRIARRDAWQHKGRSAVVLVMVALPVLGVVSLDTLFRTSDVSAAEGLDRTLGTADAQVQFSGARAIQQEPTSINYSTAADEEVAPDNPADPEPPRALAGLLPPKSRMTTVLRGSTDIKTDLGRAFADAIEIDLADPMTRGLYRLEGGRLPRAADEVLVSRRVAARGYHAGATLVLADGSARRVVGQVRWVDLSSDTRLVVGPAGSLRMPANETLRWWLVDTPQALTWSQVKELNGHGFAALSRTVVLDPPPASEVEHPSSGGGTDSATLAVIGMVVAMALLEVVLLAGPAFAVGVRRQQRSLALLAATGGRPRDVRRVVLGGGVVLGGVASVIGVAGGIAVAFAVRPLLQGSSTSLFGPFEVSVRDVAVVAGCGLLSAVLAALAPSFAAARQDVVAVLAGRRGQTRTPVWSPVLGVVLLGAGIGGSVLGGGRPSGGETYIAGAAISAVLGMVLLIPLAVAQLGRLARALPLTARFAVRDAARHRSRTAPAVAAVAATVAGVVALGIGGASDAAQNRATYTPHGPVGAAIVTDYGQSPDWSAFEATVRRQLPAAQITPLLGIVNGLDLQVAEDAPPPEGLEVQPVVGDKGNGLAGSFSTSFGANVLVGADTFRSMGLQLPNVDRERALTALRQGKAVVFAQQADALRITRARILRQRYPAGNSGGNATTVQTWTVPAVAVTAPGTDQPAQAVVPAAAVRQAGFAPTTTALLVDGIDISTADEDALTEALTGVADTAGIRVERGFRDDSSAIVLLLLGCVGGVLVLGGTLTATSLALSDARPDFATMGAVGAAPRTRRAVAAAYAATIGLVGAALGAAVGFIPGIAVTYPLTSATWAEGAVDAAGAPIADHFLDIPWLLVVGLVVGLPLLTAAVVGVTTRSRLPMVSRLS